MKEIVVCTKCDKKLLPRGRFCHHCGHKAAFFHAGEATLRKKIIATALVAAAVLTGVLCFHFQIQQNDSPNIQALSRTNSATDFQIPAPKYSLDGAANVQEAYWINDDSGRPVAVLKVDFVICNQGTGSETATLTLYTDGSPRSLGTIFLPAGGSHPGSTMVRLGGGYHSIQIVVESANGSTRVSVSIPQISFAQWPTEVRMPPKVSVTVSPPPLMYLGYEKYFTVSISNSGGPARVEARANFYEYAVQIDTGETRTLEVPQVADDLGDEAGDVWYNFSVGVSASNGYGSDEENGFAQVRVVQKPVEIWYSPLEFEGSQSFRTTLKDFFTSNGTISIISGWAGETVGGTIGGAVAGPIGGFAGALIGRWIGESAAPEAGEWEYVAQSPSVEYMVRQLERHDDSILNLKEVYYFVRDYIPYDYGKMGDPFLGIKQTFGFSIQHPVETLAFRKGICLDKAILLASMLEAQGYDAALVYAARGPIGHAFTAVYLPGHGWDHPVSGVGVPYGSSEDWLYLDAVTPGIEFGEDWTYETGFLSYKIVDVSIGEVKSSLQVVDAYWMIDNEAITTAKLGENVQAHISLIAIGGDAAGSIEFRVRKDVAWWFDRDFKTVSFSVDMPRGEVQTIGLTFTPDELSNGGFRGIRGYYLEAYWGGKKIYSMKSAYPPRLMIYDSQLL